MKLFSRFFLNPARAALTVMGLALAGMVLAPTFAHAADCTVTTDTVIDQAYVDAGSCSTISIEGNVSTTWIGTVNLQGSGTVTVRSGYTMTMGSSSEMILGSTDDFVVEATATTTHLLEDTNGLKITARNITVSGALSVSQRGCRAAGGFGDDGYGVNTTTGRCGYRTGGYGRGGGGSGGGGGGGSHAAAAGTAGGGVAGGSTIYGNSFVPAFLGSGAGSGYFFTAFGGAGGGLVHVTSTGVLTLDGTISAVGGNGIYNGSYNGGGGGAGGSILIRAGTLSGGGTISANGGRGAIGGGGGAGGRVAVYYGANGGFSLDSVTADAGSAQGAGSAGATGTTFIVDRYTDDGAGTVTVTSGFDFPASGDYIRSGYDISDGAYLRCSESMSTLAVSSTAWLALSGVSWTCANSISSVYFGSATGISTTNTALTFSAATSITVMAPAWTNVTTTIVATQSGSRASFDISSDLTVRGMVLRLGDAGTFDAFGGYLTIPRSIALSMVSSTFGASVSSTSLTAFTMDSLSLIDAMGHGCPAASAGENGYGPNTTTGVCGISTSGYGTGGGNGGGGGSGAAHGGAGGNSAATLGSSVTYGSSTNPLLYGSSGGGGYTPYTGLGASAGGVIHLSISGTATINGTLKADGGDGYFRGYTGGGGGSGGSINLAAATIAGSGTITAKGGAGANGGNGGGGGGGGRIAFSTSALTFTGTSSTSAGAAGTGSNSTAGTAGTVYVRIVNQTPSVPSSLGPASLADGSTTGTANPTLRFTLADSDLADTVKYRIQIDDSSDFATPVVDYTSALAAQGARTFQVGQAAGSGSYSVGSSGQTLADGSYYWRVKAIDSSDAGSSYATANSGAVAFEVDTATRLLSFEAATGSGLESVTATSIRILLSSEHFEDVSVAYAVTAGTATGGGVDYTLTAGTATISAGQTSTTIPLVVVDDGVYESSETLTITLSDPTFAVIGSNTSTVYTILEDDAAPVPPSSGGGAVGAGAAGALALFVPTTIQAPIGVLLPQAPAPITTAPIVPPPTEEFPPLPVSPQGFTFVNPDDVAQVIARFNGGVRNEPVESRARTDVQRDARAFGVRNLDAASQERLVTFVAYGLTPETARLGAGERRAIVRDAYETMRTVPSVADLERLARGQVPQARNLTEERRQSTRALATFRTVFGHAPDYQNPTENLAWNTLLYRIRFPRELGRERAGIREFRALFRREPQDPFQWAVVRVLGYVQE